MRFNRVDNAIFSKLLPLLIFILIGTTLFVALAEDPRQASTKPRFKDGEQNLAFAYHLYKHGTFSDSLVDQQNPLPSNRREPLYPVLLAGFLPRISNLESFNLQCLLTGKENKCLAILKRLKGINILLLLSIALSTFLAARIIVGGGNLPIISACLASLNPYLFLAVNDFYSDLLAALLLLVLSTALYLTVSQDGSSLSYASVAQSSTVERTNWQAQFAVITAGITLGCLILVKAVFIYLGLLVAGMYVWVAYRLHSYQPMRRVVILLLIAYLIVGGWVFRNYRLLNEARVAGRDGEVLAIRAEYSTMTWKEYALSFCAFTSPCSSNFLKEIDPLAYEHFHLSKPTGFYRRTMNRIRAMRQETGDLKSISVNQSEIDQGLTQDAIALIRKNWLMHLALIISFAYRGMITHFPYFIAFWFFIVVASRSHNLGLWLFLIPSIYSVAIHSLASHYIERYSVPLLPSLAILLAPLLVSFFRYLKVKLTAKRAAAL